METTTLENPVLTPDSDEAKFLEAAALADKGEDIPADLIGAQSPPDDRAPGKLGEPEVGPDGKPKPDNAESAPAETQEQKDQRLRDEQARFKKADEADKDKVKPELSEYEKAKKERERAENQLRNFQKEKDNFRAEADAERNRLRQEADRLRQQAEAPAKPKYKSQEVNEAANEFAARAEKAYEEGDLEEARRNKDLAIQARQQAGKLAEAEQREYYEGNVRQYQEGWKANMITEMRANPDDHKEGSPLREQVSSILGDTELGPIFEAIPDGFKKAVELGKLRIAAEANSALAEENKTLKAEVERLNGLTTPSRGGPAKPGEGKSSFDNMTPDQQDAYLLEQAQKIDSSRDY